jgi:class 3 adenylate cyclase
MSTMSVQDSDVDPLGEAIARLERGDCSGALAALEELDRADALTPYGREALARAAWLCGDLDRVIPAYERAFREHLEAGDSRRAGLVAVMLAWENADLLARARADGWLRRAERLLADAPEGVEHGYLALYRGRVAQLAATDLDAAAPDLERAERAGERYGDADLETLARWYRGFAFIQGGELVEGFALVDEAMAAASGGELSAFYTGFVYCLTVTVCRNIGDYRRAAEWTEAQQRWCARMGVAVFPSACRVNRASVLGMRGAWDEAEQEATTACVELEGLGLVVDLADALCELGELCLRRGDSEGAEAVLGRVQTLGGSAEPTLARLRLAQGRPAEAVALLDHALSGSPVARAARLLPLLVEARLAQGDLAAARAACTRLGEAASHVDLPFVAAGVAYASGRLRLAEGDPQEAIELLRQAACLWRDEVQAPHEAARSQYALAEAELAAGDQAAAGIDARAALAVFERLGARGDEEAARAFLQRLQPRSGPSRRVQKTFLFTDLVQSTQLVEAIGDEAWHRLLSWHDAKLRSLFATHGGQEVDHAGDGFFVTFEAADSAVTCAMAIQQTLAEHREQAGFAPELRIGLHTAEATSAADSYRGRGVHIAARIAAAAAASEILASREAAEALTDDSRVRERDALDLKGVANPVTVVAIDWERQFTSEPRQ